MSKRFVIPVKQSTLKRWKKLKKISKELFSFKKILALVDKAEIKEDDIFTKVCIYDADGNLKKEWESFKKLMKKNNKTCKEINIYIERYLNIFEDKK